MSVPVRLSVRFSRPAYRRAKGRQTVDFWPRILSTTLLLAFYSGSPERLNARPRTLKKISIGAVVASLALAASLVTAVPATAVVVSTKTAAKGIPGVTCDFRATGVPPVGKSSSTDIGPRAGKGLSPPPRTTLDGFPLRRGESFRPVGPVGWKQ